MSTVTATRRLRLKRLLALCCVAVTAYLVTHIYISYRLTRAPTDVELGDGSLPQATPTLTCTTPPVINTVLPSRPLEGIFYIPDEIGILRAVDGVIQQTYAVDERFPPLLSEGETDHAMRLVRKLTSLLSAAGVTFTLWQGTVLGSYMTHGLLPWDDDVDLAVRWADMPKVKMALRDASSMWRLYNVTSFMEDADVYSRTVLTSGDVWGKSVPNPTGRQRYHRFKFFATNSLPAGNTTWNWPNIDVLFYQENATHVWSHSEPDMAEYFPRAIFYPLHRRPLGAMWLPSPADSHSYLTLRYGNNFRCSTPTKNHRLERPRQAIAVPCCALYWTYPIVLRQATSGGVMESLLLGNETQHAAFVKEKLMVLGPYQL